MNFSDLGTATDDLNDLLLAAESRLQAYSHGVTALVKLDEEHELIFTKRGDEWGLWVNGVRLTSTTRRVRIMAAHALGKLREELRIRLGNELGDVMAARRAVREFLGLQKSEEIIDGEFAETGEAST